MKIAPLVHEIRDSNHEIDLCLVHTGQHYDFEMSKVFFNELEIPEPDYFLNARSGSHAVQTATIMTEFEKVCIQENPDLVIVVGDVNSTLACSITAKKLNHKVAHIEAGLRSGDKTMPEEINRIVTDSISDLLFVTEPSGLANLKLEGKNRETTFFVGNIMIDTLIRSLQKLKGCKPQQDCEKEPFAVLTLHRPSNVDNQEKLSDIFSALTEISNDLPIHFPIHPRTQKKIEEFGLNEVISQSNIKLRSPMSYLDFLELWKEAALVLTDSGGLQEETTAIGIPCFTIRENTERPITIDQGTNSLVGTAGKEILKAYHEFRKGNCNDGNTVPDLWDGKTAGRILKILISHIQ